MKETIFEFSTKVTESVIKELERAEAFIKIAMFQIHRSEIFETLEKKLKQGVKVEIITLPYDSIKEDVRQAVQERFERLEKTGAMLHFCRWNIGDPARTTTAVGRWYSFHGKMIVTDKSCMALTANFTEENELDALIIFRNDEFKKEFLEKFELLLKMFIIPDGKYAGMIRRMICDKVGQDDRFFKLPKEIPDIHKEFWIMDYPAEMCPLVDELADGVYVAPFECRGRHLIEKVLEEAEKYVYISTETFTDADFSNFLIKTVVNKDIELRLLCGTTSMDFNDRVNDMLRNMLAQNIRVRTPETNIHGKLIITDKATVISSINLNKMGLGFSRTKQVWRENTETILVSRNSDIIDLARMDYLEIFDSCIDVKDKLSQKLENVAKDVLKGVYQLIPNREARTLFAKLILRQQIDVKKFPIQLGRLVNLLVRRFNRITVTKDDILSAMVLYTLSENKQNFNQLQDKMRELDEGEHLKAILFSLEKRGLIITENDFYKLNLNELLK